MKDENALNEIEQLGNALDQIENLDTALELLRPTPGLLGGTPVSRMHNLLLLLGMSLAEPPYDDPLLILLRSLTKEIRARQRLGLLLEDANAKLNEMRRNEYVSFEKVVNSQGNELVVTMIKQITALRTNWQNCEKSKEGLKQLIDEKQLLLEQQRDESEALLAKATHQHAQEIHDLRLALNGQRNVAISDDHLPYAVEIDRLTREVFDLKNENQVLNDRLHLMTEIWSSS